MHTLRPYQQEALDATRAHWKEGGKNPLVDLATGTGKALYIAALIQWAFAISASVRILMLVHTKELVAQNAKEIRGLIPGIDLGILCGNLNSYDTTQRLICATVQSAASRLDELGERTLIIVDECHRVPHNAQGQYGRIIAHMVERNPKTKVSGCTASPYRLDSGRLDEGKGRLFDKLVYTYDIADGIADGYLAPLISKATALKLSTAGVGRSGGEFKPGELQAAVDLQEITAAAVDEMWRWKEETGRRKTLVFCAGVEHAKHVADAMAVRGWRVKAVTGDMDQGERDGAIEAFKTGRLDALTSVDILTTGFNVPDVDLLAMLRPTLSTGLYVQMLGRATRPVYPAGFNQHTATLEERLAAIASGPKPNALVLDFAGNVRRHGPVDAVRVRTESGKASVKDHEPDEGKTCANCQEVVKRSVRICPVCETVFPTRETGHDAEADGDSAIMSSEGGAAMWKRVQHVGFWVNEKPGKPNTLRVNYRFTDGTKAAEWICLEHPRGSMAGSRAVRWWSQVMREEPVPHHVDQDLTRRCYARAREVAVTHVRHGKDAGGFDRVTDRLVTDGEKVWLVVENCTPRPASKEDAGLALDAFGPKRPARGMTEDEYESQFVNAALKHLPEAKDRPRPPYRAERGFVFDAADDEIPY